MKSRRPSVRSVTLSNSVRSVTLSNSHPAMCGAKAKKMPSPTVWKIRPLGALAIHPATEPIRNTVAKRGRAYIDLGRNRADEAEDLIVSMKKVGGDLQDNYDKSSERIDNLQNANSLLEASAAEITQGSINISREAREVELVCDDVHARMQLTENSVQAMNDEVRGVQQFYRRRCCNQQECNNRLQREDIYIQRGCWLNRYRV